MLVPRRTQWIVMGVLAVMLGWAVWRNFSTYFQGMHGLGIEEPGVPALTAVSLLEAGQGAHSREVSLLTAAAAGMSLGLGMAIAFVAPFALWAMRAIWKREEKIARLEGAEG